MTLLLIIHCKVLSESDEQILLEKAKPLLVNSLFLSKTDYDSIEFWFENDKSCLNSLGIIF